MISIKNAKMRGFSVDDVAPGRPLAYKGPRFNPTETMWCYTDLETKMLRAIELADNIMDYCHGDTWERECTADDRKEYLALCEEIQPT